MIRMIKLSRFKAFREASLAISPITIVAGQNSSGKSSIIQAINAVTQSTLGRAFPFDLVLNGDRAHLGGFKNVVHGHNARNSFGIGIEFDDQGERVLLDATFKKSDEEGHLFPRLVEISIGQSGDFKIEWNQKRQQFCVTISPSEDIIELEKQHLHTVIQRLIASEGKSKEKIQAFIESFGSNDSNSAVRAVGQLISAAAEETKEGLWVDAKTIAALLSEASHNPIFESFRRRSSEALSRLRRSCSYIGPVRAVPSRYYPLAGADGIDSAGEGMSRVLAKWKDRRSALIAELKAALSKLELAGDLSAIVEHDEFLKVLIKPFGRGAQDSLADVGFGLSQVMPMIVADLNLPDGGGLLINQPEIHLHPSSQALLANYFSERRGRRQYIVETHSEYLINRLRLLVVKGQLPANEVSIIYCAADDKGGSVVYPITIGSNGALEGAPQEFFSTYSADAFGIAMAVMEDSAHASE